MPLIINLTWVSSTIPISLLPRELITASKTCSTIFHRASSSPSTSRPLIVKCTRSTSGESGSLKDALSGIVGEQVEELLKKEENRDLLDGLEKASQRVEMAKRELAEIEKQELEAKLVRDYINQLESRASESGNGEIDKDKERWQSIKAASISALVGTVAGLPFSFTQVSSGSELILPLAITFVSCALFGVTFRYAVRRDLDDVHLKTGAPAAFGVVKGLATLDGGQPLELNAGSFLSHAFDGALYVSQSLFVFLSAAIALDYCFKVRLLSPFPIKNPVSGSNSR
ncbi:hypothetical protein GBA52_017003 [Prunus armeniaca]|nr:hypothetical protein GBA52_017003 [Prunus armeniaca]